MLQKYANRKIDVEFIVNLELMLDGDVFSMGAKNVDTGRCFVDKCA